MGREYIGDLGHPVLQTSEVGRLTCLMRLPVIAGDSIELNERIMVRLAQLRRPLAVDPKLDVFAFYCPYRHTYGQDWINYIEAGGKETVTFPTLSTLRLAFMLSDQTTIPKHVWADYARIYNHYFRDPSWAELDENTALTGAANNENSWYGLRIANLKSWGTAQSGLGDNNDAEFDIDVSGSNINFYDIQQGRTQLTQENLRNYVSSRYSEIMNSMSGSYPDDNVDDRPELIWGDDEWFSGYDVNGTSGAEHGASVGKGIAMMNFRFPRRFFPEHGTVYVMATVRFPPIYKGSIQYLDNFNRPFEYVCPMESTNMPPVELTQADLFDGGGAGSFGHVPFAQWYREHPGFVNERISDIEQGWPYMDTPTDLLGAQQHPAMNQLFQTQPIGQTLFSVYNGLEAWRPLGDPLDSIMGSAQ